jgi:hypothetical protein
MLGGRCKYNRLPYEGRPFFSMRGDVQCAPVGHGGAVEFLQSSATLRFHRARDFAIRRNIRRIRAVVLADFRELLANFVDPRLSASAEPHVKFVEALLAGSVQLRDRAGHEAPSLLDRRLGRCRGE